MSQDLLSIFYYKHHFDSFYYKDLKPGFIELGRTMAWMYDYGSNFIKTRNLRKKHLKIKQTKALVQPLQQANNLLFLCYGNINRSAAAECVFLQQPGKKNHTVQSAGFHPKDRRSADPNMIQIAKEQHFDMQNWSSHSVNTQMVEAADLIFVMEIEHMFKLAALCPQSQHKVYLMGSIDPDVKTPLEISDPYGKTLDEYRTCFNHIKNCIGCIGQDNP